MNEDTGLDGVCDEEYFLAPASFAQRQMAILERQKPGQPTYTMTLAWRIQGELDRPALAWAVDELVRRHETLRTTLTWKGNALFQRVSRRRDGILTIDEGIAFAGQADRLDLLLLDNAAQALDLHTGPVFVARLIRLGADEHVLLLALHHAMGDEQSLYLIASQLWNFYRQHAGLPFAHLAAPVVQYADYAAWQASQLDPETQERLLQYWQNKLAGATFLLDLPNVPSAAAADLPGAQENWVPFRLSQPESKWIQALAADCQASLFMTCAALLQVLIHRCSGVDDFLLGFPSTGRRFSELEDVVGMFVNMLPMRARITSHDTISTLVSRVRDDVLESQEHGEVPFERIVNRLSPVRQKGRNPLFQVALSVASEQLVERGIDGLRLEPLATPRTVSKFDLVLYVTELEGHIHGGFEFDTGRYSRQTVQRLCNRLSRLVCEIMKKPGQRVANVNLLSRCELEELEKLGSGEEEPGPFLAIPEQVERHCSHAPDAVALLHNDEAVTYAELEKQAVGLQSVLQAFGLRQGEPVGIAIAPSAKMVVAMLGILRAGGAYVPLDPGLPRPTLERIATDLDMRLYIVSGAGQDPALSNVKSKIWLSEIAACSDYVPIVPVHFEQPCYFISTSGSTGRPKLVAIPHRGLSALVSWHRSRYRVSKSTVMSQLANMMFDACAWEIWSCLGSGGTLAILSGNLLVAPAHLADILEQYGVEQAFVPTPFAKPLMAALREREGPLTLRHLLAGGDRLGSIGQVPVGVTLSNHYGPTEASVVATATALPQAGAEGLPPIGRAIAGTYVRLLDATGQLATRGATAELCIGGRGLALGYWGQPRETAERFVPDANSAQLGARIYRSGDLVSWREDGQLAFIGRADDQFQRNGVRIEPGEIEVALLALPGVQAAAVVWFAAEHSLVAVFVATEADMDVRTMLAERLPRHLIPDTFLQLDAIPHSRSGKPDRVKIGDIVAARCAAEPDRLPPDADPLLREVAAIWCDLLGVQSVGAKSDFFALGGGSMLLMQLAGALQAKYCIEVDLARLFEAPILEQHCSYLAATRAQSSDDTSGAVDTEFEEGVL